MNKKGYSYVISPVAYTKDGEDRTFDSPVFDSREEADEFINDMGSRWVLYPNIEIFRVKGDGKSFSKEDLQLVVGYSEEGEYGPPEKKKKAKPKKRKATRVRKSSPGLSSSRR